MLVKYAGEGNCIRFICDDNNPKLYSVAYRCTECSTWVENADTVWIKSPVRGDDDYPYCALCAKERR